MKKLYSVLFVFSAILCGGLASFFIINSQLNPSQDAETYVSVSINPAVEFTVNCDDKVISTLATDAEGDEIVQSYNFYGMYIDDACAKFTQLCTEAGYVNLDADETNGDENDVVITVVNANETVMAQIRTRIQSKIQTYFLNNGIFGKVSQDTLDEYLSEATTYGLSVGHIKLIMRALDYNPDLTVEELANMTVKEVVALLQTEHQTVGATVSSIREQLRTDIQALKTSDTYADMFVLIAEIKDLTIQLEDTTLTEEEITTLQNELDTKQADFEDTFADLFVQYKEDRAELIAQAKEDSTTLLEEVKNTFKEKINTHKQAMQALKSRLQNNANLRERIQEWLDGLES